MAERDQHGVLVDERVDLRVELCAPLLDADGLCDAAALRHALCEVVPDPRVLREDDEEKEGVNTPVRERLDPCETEGEFDNRADAVWLLLFAPDALPDEHLEANRLALLSATDAVAQSEGGGVEEDVRRDVDELDMDADDTAVAVPQLVFDTIRETRLEIVARALAEAHLVI